MPLRSIHLRQLCLLCLTCLMLALAPAHWVNAQTPGTPAPGAETPALDMREEVLYTQATVKDLYGRQETRPLPITVYRPAGEGPFPLVVFNHGRSVAAKRATQGRSRPEALARYLVAKGFVVLVPTRIGYWQSYGDFDPESNGSCSGMQVEPMSLAASDQVLATVEFARSLPYVDASRWIVAGQSVGGLTAVATVGRAPAGLLGGINFSGGAGGNPELKPGAPCSPQVIARYWGSLAATARVPMAWLYWENDKYWGPDVPQTWHQAWVQGGGRATLTRLEPSGSDGHNGLNEDMTHWLPVVDAFLQQLGFASPAIAQRPLPSGFAELQAAERVPVKPLGKAAYSRFLASAPPRAFAVGQQGGWGMANGDYAIGRALGNCQHYGQRCKLYAVDEDVVWTGP